MPAQPEPALKSIQFRKHRGQRLRRILEKGLDEPDDFWKDNRYFGKD
jgi:hypothetical protein